jgi:alkanesulfonate monooxygenase SsuD/methylene tetrahydromethanopterin reductase-like flavin-dependent oxidoreductase (luciferase family)
MRSTWPLVQGCLILVSRGAQPLRANLMFGTPAEVIAKLRRYEAFGVDNFCYSASYGLPMDVQKRSLQLFIDEVMPAFAAVPAGVPALSG